MFDATETADLQDLRRELNDAIDQQRRSDCMARIQSDAVQLALHLVVRESDIGGFFRAFIRTLVEECESRACGGHLGKRRVTGLCCRRGAGGQKREHEEREDTSRDAGCGGKT